MSSATIGTKNRGMCLMSLNKYLTAVKNLTGIKVKCDKCGKEHKTAFWEPGQCHKDCGGEFKPIRGV